MYNGHIREKRSDLTGGDCQRMLNEKCELKLLHTSPRQPITPYFHSYGVTTNNVVLAYTPMEYNMWESIIGSPMPVSSAFTQAKVPSHPRAAGSSHLLTQCGVVPGTQDQLPRDSVRRPPELCQLRRAPGVHHQPPGECLRERNGHRVRRSHIPGGNPCDAVCLPQCSVYGADRMQSCGWWGAVPRSTSSETRLLGTTLG